VRQARRSGRRARRSAVGGAAAHGTADAREVADDDWNILLLVIGECDTVIIVRWHGWLICLRILLQIVRA
jgi:hypothetical protein